MGSGGRPDNRAVPFFVAMTAGLAHSCAMRRALPFALMFLLAACNNTEDRGDSVSPAEASALNNAAAKVEAEQLPADK